MVAYGAVSLYHLDCFSGLSGDMFLGACLDLGMPLDLLREAVEVLGLGSSVALASREEARAALRGTRFEVALKERDGGEHESHARRSEEPARDYGEIRRLLTRSALAAPVRERALRLFARLAEAESRVHGVAVDKVHFHEIGAIDSIVDLVGAAVAWEWLRPARLTCGEVNVGDGIVATQHGSLPVPAPATAELLRGIPAYATTGGELLTPTGCVLLAELVDAFTPGPELKTEAVGYGLGARELSGRPNAVRLWKGEPLDGSVAAGGEPARAMVIECQLDDASPEALGFAMERLLANGALDVYFTPVQMKKNRPGTLLTVICRSADLEALSTHLLVETGSLGCRFYAVQRFEAKRESHEVATRFGKVRVKRGTFAGHAVAAAPESDDCRRLALEHGVPWREVYEAAIEAARQGAAD